ncbi:MAG: glycosyltransferase family 2 protein [Anaerolineales bacterium]
MTSLSVVIPAFNEEDGIAHIASRVISVRERLAEMGIQELELLIVDDGSHDETAAKAESIEGATVIRHPTNLGYGAALKTGFAMSKGELVGFLDADGTYPPERFPELCYEALNGSDLVIGSRMGDAESQMPITRRLGNFLFAGLLTVLGPQRVTDSASGMRVFRREILERIYPLPDGLNLTPIMSVRALHEGIKIKEVPIPYAERVGHSKLSVVRDGSLFLRSIIWGVMGYNPVRILGMLGLAGVAASAMIGVGLVVIRLRGVTELTPAAVAVLYAALLLGVGGISLFSLGTTFNYLVSLFHKQPIRQGLFGPPVFKTPLEAQFGWMGLTMVIIGIVVAVGSLVLGMRGWQVERLWLYLLGSAMFLLVGMQMMVTWVLSRVLSELSEREILTARDIELA